MTSRSGAIVASPPAMPALPAPRTRLTPRAAILAVVVTALLLYLAVPVRTYLAERDRLAQLERQTQVLERQNAALKREASKLHDPVYLELIARQCLGMVKRGEIAFIAVPKGGTAKPASC